MAGESISIPIDTPGADSAARNIKQVGDAAAGTAGKLDVAAASLEAFNVASVKSKKATDTLIQSKLAAAKADTTLAKAESFISGEADKAERILSGQGATLDDTAKKATAAAGATTALAGGGGLAGGGMGALIGAGVALAPVLATVGTGLGGLALAALATGKHSKLLAQTIAPLKQDFAAFQQQLQPTLLRDFAGAATLAGHVLADIEPVTVATGKALGGLFGQVDATFASSTWQGFFKFMAATAAPDVALLGRTFSDLLLALPPLVEQLQPVAVDLLSIADAVSKLIGTLGQANQHFDTTAHHGNVLAQTTDLLRTVLFEPGVGLYHALQLIGVISKPAAQGIGLVGALAKPAATQVYTLTTASDHLGKASVTLVLAQEKTAAAFLATHNQAVAAATGVKELTNQFIAGLNPLLAYTNALITQHNDATALAAALKKSGDAVGFDTAAKRSSFQAAQTYIGDLENTASAALASHQGIDKQITSLQNALPILKNVQGGTRQYWQEVRTLIDYLDRLRRERSITELIHVSGTGTWTISPSKSLGLPGGTAGGPFATGGLVPGSGSGDTFPAMLTPGEAVVPKRLTPAVAPFLHANKVPGFAAGGVVGSYHGPVAGISPWTTGNLNATTGLLEHAVAQATFNGIRAAAQAATFGAPGPGGGAPAANAALARSMYPAWGSGAEWAAWNYVAMRESGWNQYARNPSSGAYGIPQALPPGKMGAAANPPQSNPRAQIAWMIGYIASRYRDPVGAAAHEQAFGWYDRGGFLPTGLSLAYNGTGRPEMVIPGRSSAGQIGGQVVNVYVTVGHGTHPVAAAQEIAKVLNVGAKNGVKLRTSILGPG